MPKYKIKTYINSKTICHFEEFKGEFEDVEQRAKQICFSLQSIFPKTMVTVDIYKYNTNNRDNQRVHTEMIYIPAEHCKDGYVYRMRARNGRIGIFKKHKEPDAMGSCTNVFTLSRFKGKNNYLFDEYHFDNGPPFGTVMPFNCLFKAPNFESERETIDYLNKLTKETQGVEYPDLMITQEHPYVGPDIVTKDEIIEELLETVAFYANPETYFAIGFFPDPPCGEFMEDFSDTDELGVKPGKMARNLLGKYSKHLPQE